MITIVIVKPCGIIHIAFRVHALSNVIKMLAMPPQWVLLTYTALTAVGFQMHARWATGKSGAAT